MKKLTFIPAVFAVSLFMAACSSTPTTTSMLDRARGDYMAAQNNPSVAASAPLEFKAASDALNRANDAAAKNDSLEHIDQLAYIATQKIATAQQVAHQEADQAKAAADQARMQAVQAQNSAANAQAATADAQARATALAAELADLQAKQTERGMVITLSDVLFNTDRAELSADGMSTARKLADVLTQNPERSVLIEGFTDSTGSAAHNLELSQRRAESVRAALVGMGVAASRVATKGYGEAYPVAANDSSGDRQLNRRVEIVLSQNGNPIAARR